MSKPLEEILQLVSASGVKSEDGVIGAQTAKAVGIPDPLTSLRAIVRNEVRTKKQKHAIERRSDRD